MMGGHFVRIGGHSLFHWTSTTKVTKHSAFAIYMTARSTESEAPPTPTFYLCSGVRRDSLYAAHVAAYVCPAHFAGSSKLESAMVTTNSKAVARIVAGGQTKCTPAELRSSSSLNARGKSKAGQKCMNGSRTRGEHEW
jgi:hypothetical protein